MTPHPDRLVLPQYPRVDTADPALDTGAREVLMPSEVGAVTW